MAHLHERAHPPRRALVRLVGDVDVDTAARLAELGARLALDATDVVLLDLSEVSFMDCAGLGAVVGLSGRVAGGVVLCRVPPPVADLLALTGMERAFPRAEDTPSPVEIECVWPADLPLGGRLVP